MLTQILLFALGLVLLVKGSSIFVGSASRIAKKLGISDFIIGLTLVAFATSIPELSNSLISSVNGFNEIILGNIIGSNTVNLSIVLGLMAFIGVIKIERDTVSRDAVIMIFVFYLFFVFALNGKISRIESILLLLVYFSYIMYLFKPHKVFKEYRFIDFLKYLFTLGFLNTLFELFRPKKKKYIDLHLKTYSCQIEDILVDLLVIGVSMIIIVQGSRLVIDKTIWLASAFNVSQNVIAFTLVALGTTLPELTVSFMALKRGLKSMAVGNLIGSNIFNITFIIGLSSLIHPLIVVKNALIYTIPFMLFISSFCFFLMKSKPRLSRLEGSVLLTLYFSFMIGSYLLP
ncbi:calcium/sodium antiporter [Candidatus Woesearchaeota archaeon]|nr:calcium/sodium antiporter [Candidatus Woesearchaeota archaeon]